jgi:geranylgeranyl reductase family protein
MTLPGATYEVAIIGAGPAGATLAYELLQGGVETILIDKAVFPRVKVCGGGLTIKALKFLPPDLCEVLENEIRRVKLSFGLTQTFTKASPQPLMHTVERRRFDAALVDRVRCARGEFREGERLQQIIADTGKAYTITTSRGSLKARVVVGADGARSRVAAGVGLQPVDFFHLGLQAEVPQGLISKNAIDFKQTIFLDMGSIPDGYAWAFPRGDLLVIGVGGLLSQGMQLKEYFSRITAHFGLAPHDFSLSAHLIPHRVTPKSIVRDRALLVGDAAGLTDFWTGEGINFALESAHLAARQILKFFRGDGQALNDYQTHVDREITPELAASYQFSKLFNHFGPLAFRCLKHYDYPWEVFCRIMRGDRSFVELKKRFRPDIFFRKLLVKSARNRPIA